ncbi:MAG: hypothetical protein A3B90_03255 [Candidatus Magasanikbacteria bacterium RIFCSPHIGHO2_02_FULL_41_13]|uniref:Uncharacterized protein n=1 Tax=Candidatus Magasanikbacteria bacterium RIFCSPHIGHO2_02_FULL_41_13 TaxID=1798676 RepID=A0A1F6M678_9BACT|nr:MAG: hypothetical protein A3B90_03255 [Candidatus Magasanikbacteria bacterium RIFCSPHIGHO2_02_FULL_41_13]
MTDTKTKTQTVTNTQLAVAVVAAFLAGGLAFAAAPAGNNKAALVPGACVLSEASMVYTHAINKTRQLCPNNGYWGARFTCTDRKNDSVNVGVGNPCVSQEAILAMARAKCTTLTHSCMPRVVAPIVLPAAPQISLSIETRDPGIRYNKFIVGGDGGMLGKLVMTNTSTNPMQIDSLSLVILPQWGDGIWSGFVTNIADVVERLENIPLYSSSGDDINVNQLVSLGQIAQNGTVNFQNLNLQIPANSNTTLYVGAGARPYQGNVRNAIPSFRLAFNQDKTQYQIRDTVSGQSVSPYLNPYTNTSTVEADIVPLKMDIRIDPRDVRGGQLVGGEQNILAFNIGPNLNQNVDENGDAVQGRINRVSIALTTDMINLIRTPTTTPLQLCNVDSAHCIPVAVTGRGGVNNQGVIELQIGTAGQADIDMTAFPDPRDITVGNEGVLRFVFKGIFQPEVNKFIQAKVRRAWAGGVEYQFNLQGDARPEGIIYDLKEDEPRGQNWPHILGPVFNG